MRSRGAARSCWPPASRRKRGVHKRVITRSLAAATAVAAVGLAAGGTAGPLLAADLAGEQAAGWPITALTAGAALSAPLMAVLGARRDRELALRAGHLVAAIGAAAAIKASFALLLVGTVALGAGNTAIFLARYAAAAISAPGHLARAHAFGCRSPGRSAGRSR